MVSDLRVSSSGAVPASNHANSSGVDCLLAFDLLVAASDTHRVGADQARTVVIGSVAGHADGCDGRRTRRRTTPRWRRSPAGSARCPRTADNRFLDAIAIGDRRCSGTRRRPTSCCSASPCSMAPSRSIRRRSSGRSSSTGWRSPATSPRSGGAGGGRSSPTRWPGRPTSRSRHRRKRSTSSSTGSPMTSSATSRSAYAKRFRRLVDVARAAERRVDPASTAFTEAVARYGYKLMAYKDEYEVARLLLAPEARAGYEAVGGPDAKVTWRLHPPMLRSMGLKHKMKLGPTTQADARGLGQVQAGARHGRRPVPLGRGAAPRTGDDPGVRSCRRAARRAAHCRQPRRGGGHRLAPRSGPRLRAPQAEPR